jgi:hypothetical protein
MQAQKQTVPFECAVYVRAPRAGDYVFSHYCPSLVCKPLPKSLRVKDMREFARQPSLVSTLRKSFFLVLVAGDVAQCVSTANVGEKRVRFLYRGSEYARPPRPAPPRCTKFHEDYIPLHFYSALVSFSRGEPCGLTCLESGIALFPRSIREQDLPTLARWVEHALVKAAHSTTWITERSESYSEHSLALHATKMKV